VFARRRRNRGKSICRGKKKKKNQRGKKRKGEQGGFLLTASHGKNKRGGSEMDRATGAREIVMDKEQGNRKEDGEGMFEREV